MSTISTVSTVLAAKWRVKLRFNLVVGGALFAVAVFVGLFADWLAHTDPVMDANLLNAEEPPSWKWWFGTDAQGRDIYSRVVHGARIENVFGRERHVFTMATLTGSILYRQPLDEKVDFVAGGGLGYQRAHVDFTLDQFGRFDRT